VNVHSVLLKPLLSEKSNKVRESQGKYTFEVRLDATKGDVERAVSTIYGVKVTAVQTVIVRTKVKRRKNSLTSPHKFKKAVVTLAEGAKLPVFEDQ
jgi:large subunit ribosomal protein L23